MTLVLFASSGYCFGVLTRSTGPKRSTQNFWKTGNQVSIRSRFVEQDAIMLKKGLVTMKM
ncbi:MAG: hypothetical protein CMM47_08840 [Rhodospirillaceae bacterium]|nr:hypothetical protein [Rhodospirillaceae bacterium]